MLTIFETIAGIITFPCFAIFVAAQNRLAIEKDNEAVKELDGKVLHYIYDDA